MTEKERLYKKDRQKRVVINLILSDYTRWSSYAALQSMPMASMIRKAVETQITEIEDSFDQKIEDILEYQQKLKVQKL